MIQASAAMPTAKRISQIPSAESGYRDKITGLKSFAFQTKCETQARKVTSIFGAVATYNEEAMLVSHEREKMINAVIYFAKNTRFMGKIKLCKLLYFLDFEHFKDTGRSVTGMDYFAWRMGPVPVDLYEEVDMPEPDLAERVEFIEKPTRNGTMLVVRPLADFDDSHFTKRELRIMQGLAEEFRDMRADDMIEATHLENQPWHRIYVEEQKRQQKIPYGLALRKQEADAMQDVIAEREAFVEHFRPA
ncbi:MAG: Panacea domain-containing protein [Candidatus Accumulibacter necessarius]|jgi:uncharacterized phage-associated protein|uniref:Panacea domain-containing protein n=1 Tax=Candidatus Accumulibacter necessarius TaxID=2954386 RepID=UPI002FC3CA79